MVVDVAADTLRRSVLGRLRRLPRVIGGWLRVLSEPGLSGGTLYMSLSGGWGQVYEIPFVLLAKLRRMRIVLHHLLHRVLERDDAHVHRLLRQLLHELLYRVFLAGPLHRAPEGLRLRHGRRSSPAGVGLRG